MNFKNVFPTMISSPLRLTENAAGAAAAGRPNDSAAIRKRAPADSRFMNIVVVEYVEDETHTYATAGVLDAARMTCCAADAPETLRHEHPH